MMNKCISSRLNESCNEDYGYYDDLEYLHFKHNIESFESLSDSCISESSSTTSQVSNSSNWLENTVIVGSFDNCRTASSVCRSFSDLNNICILPACLSLDGFRIIHDRFGEDIEYKLVLKVAEMEYVAWRRFNEFESIANACFEYSKKFDHQWTSTTYLSTLCNTLSSWNKVIENRPWFGRTLSVKFILSELELLDGFVKNLLFEVPCLQFLLEFVCSKD
jgi:hypothetical protein